MTDTILSSATKEVVIGFDRPFVLIGERINPTGRKLLAAEMKGGDYSRVKADALAQIAAGAHILDVNAGIPLADEPRILAEVIQLIQSLTDIPLCIDSSIVEALEAGLRVYQGKALVNSVTGEDEQMVAVFWYSPWCKACKAASPGIKTIAKHHQNIKFIKVPVLEENSILHQGLNVPSVPYMHLYTPDDPRLVEERKMTRKKLSGFQKMLSDYEDGSCSLDRMNNEWSTSNPYSFTSTQINTRSRNNNNFSNMMGKVGVVTP